MVDEAQICLYIRLPLRLRVDSKLGERKLSSLPPQLNGSFDFRSPQQIWLLGSLWRVRHHGSRAVHVIAPNLVFCAIAAVSMSAFETCQTTFRPYHCGKVSSQRMCLLLQVLQPFRDFV